MKTDDMVILSKILEDTHKITRYVHGCDQDSFLANEEKQDAVIMVLLTLGERVNQLSEEFKKANVNIPWARIYGFRNIAAHHYDTLSVLDVWVFAHKSVPILRKQIEQIVGDPT